MVATLLYEELYLADGLRGLLSGGKVIVVGCGNRDRGDDGWGPALTDALTSRTNVAVLDAGTCPENSVDLVAARRPDIVLFADTAELGRPPGRVMLVDVAGLAAGGTSCHAGSLRLSAKYISTRCGAACCCLLAQPRSIPAPGASPAGLSRPLRRSVHRVCRMIEDAVASRDGPNTAPVPCFLKTTS